MERVKWFCEDCQQVWSLDELDKDYCDGGYRGEPHYTCPDCGSDELTEAYQCEMCGEWFVYEYIHGSAGQMVCDKCLEEHMTADEVLDFAEEDRTEIELNGLLAFAFDEGDINEMLKTAFLRLPKSEQEQYIKDYIEDTKSEFAEYLTM